MDIISGFSKLDKNEKITWLSGQLPEDTRAEFLKISEFWHPNKDTQKLIDEFSENTISNFIFPYGVVPNLKINNEIFTAPMVIEESSVVAACSKSAKFWLDRGGFKAKVISTTKKGQVHFSWKGDKEKLYDFFSIIESDLLFCVKKDIQNMEKRGGGIKEISLIDRTDALENYFQLDVSFETCDAMGANFINTVLEAFGRELKALAITHKAFNDVEREIEIIMCILSNYTPDCLVAASVECPVSELGSFGDMSGEEFAKRFERAVKIAKVDVNRAVTHNKGIYNGIDAVILATGNDFRSIEACGHAYASRDGHYRGLSSCSVRDGIFKFELHLPLALGTVGGLTNLHPMAKMSLKLLGDPTAKELMEIVACVGLAQNFGALTSLVTTGIQKGHMKMHLLNILNGFNASTEQISLAKEHFKSHTVSYQSVREFLGHNQSVH